MNKLTILLLAALLMSAFAFRVRQDAGVDAGVDAGADTGADASADAGTDASTDGEVVEADPASEIAPVEVDPIVVPEVDASPAGDDTTGDDTTGDDTTGDDTTGGDAVEVDETAPAGDESFEELADAAAPDASEVDPTAEEVVPEDLTGATGEEEVEEAAEEANETEEGEVPNCQASGDAVSTYNEFCEYDDGSVVYYNWRYYADWEYYYEDACLVEDDGSEVCNECYQLIGEYADFFCFPDAGAENVLVQRADITTPAAQILVDTE